MHAHLPLLEQDKKSGQTVMVFLEQSFFCFIWPQTKQINPSILFWLWTRIYLESTSSIVVSHLFSAESNYRERQKNLWIADKPCAIINIFKKNACSDLVALLQMKQLFPVTCNISFGFSCSFLCFFPSQVGTLLWSQLQAEWTSSLTHPGEWSTGEWWVWRKRETVAGSAPGWKRQVLDSFSITFYAPLYSKLPFISQCQKDDKGIVCSTASQLGSTVGCFCLLVVSLLQVTLSSMSLWARFTNRLHQRKPLFSIKNYWQYLLKAQSEKCVHCICICISFNAGPVVCNTAKPPQHNGNNGYKPQHSEISTTQQN